MRFMMIVKGDRAFEAGAPPRPELMAAINELVQEHTKAGILVGNGGLLPSKMGARIDVNHGKLSVTDGPFTESKELVGGYAIFDVESKAQAVELGKRFMQLHADILGPSYEARLEIRQMYDEAEVCGEGRDG